MNLWRTPKWLISFAVIGLFAFGLYSVYRANEAMRNSYGVWWVADMCVDHMKANANDWPRSWNDLRDDYQTAVDRSGEPWSFEELSQRVVVDWNANPREWDLDSGDMPAKLKVIWLSDGTDAHWSLREPNQIVQDYVLTLSSAQEQVSGTP